MVKDGGEQFKEDYARLCPMSQVPTLIDGDVTLTQSVAIMEYLNDNYKGQRPLLPEDPKSKAKAREIVEIICSGTQPVQNLSVMRKAREDKDGQVAWSAYFIEKGLKGTLE